MVTSRPTVIDRWDDNRLATDYMKQVHLDDARVWFRYRSRMTVRVKANESSAFRQHKMQTPARMESRNTSKYDISKPDEKLIYWRRL